MDLIDTWHKSTHRILGIFLSNLIASLGQFVSLSGEFDPFCSTSLSSPDRSCPYQAKVFRLYKFLWLSVTILGELAKLDCFPQKMSLLEKIIVFSNKFILKPYLGWKKWRKDWLLLLSISGKNFLFMVMWASLSYCGHVNLPFLLRSFRIIEIYWKSIATYFSPLILSHCYSKVATSFTFTLD